MLWIWMMLTLAMIACILHLFPSAAALMTRKQHNHVADLPPVRNIDILIPCHNEHGNLRKTLASIKRSEAEARKIFPDLGISVFVGLDSCTDDTVTDASNYQAQKFYYSYRSKWQVICSLIEQSTADWIALVDAGAIWDRRLLRNIIPFTAISSVSGIAATYRRRKMNILSKLLWALEAQLKAIENLSGGPVSVHGLTVFYKREHLIHVLRVLHGRRWINDDVVIPLAMRLIYPSQKILYCQNKYGGYSVCDAAPRKPSAEQHARRRVAAGNLQWIHHLLPLALATCQPVHLIAMRRVFRLIWALIPIGLLLATNFYFITAVSPENLHNTIVIGTAVTSVALYVLSRNASFLASLLAAKNIVIKKYGPEREELPWN